MSSINLLVGNLLNVAAILRPDSVLSRETVFRFHGGAPSAREEKVFQRLKALLHALLVRRA